ncbi:hypothetical protein L3X38_024294 [Prunus dulcis]|uniref:Aminotransferase-like plant mobile domain-containing protein n=1 Tax=Prunus dulcis TaxID=3755 RepID=A0AAD4Z6A3_PRUDU|nr:hypothetical protein L3X38_024294 [Prunus dulcis]
MYWLYRFIFPSAFNCITTEWLHLAKGLASHRDIATGPLTLALIYRALREATVERVNRNVKGPLWMVQIWLERTFPELRGRKLQVAHGVEPLRDLVLNSVSGKTTEECFTFFMGRKSRPVSQWMMNLNRDATYKRVFKGCPFRQELSEQGRCALLERIAVDNKLPLIVSTCYQTLCSLAQLAALAQGSLGIGLSLALSKTPILVQRRWNLGKAEIPVSPASKTASLLRTQEADQGDGAQAQPEVAQIKRARASTVEYLESAAIAPQVLIILPSPIPILVHVVEVSDEEVAEADEVVPPACSPLLGISRETSSSEV